MTILFTMLILMAVCIIGTAIICNLIWVNTMKNTTDVLAKSVEERKSAEKHFKEVCDKAIHTCRKPPEYKFEILEEARKFIQEEEKRNKS